MTENEVNSWVEKYVHAWRSYDEADIASLFTEDAEYHEWPYDTAWIGRDRIVAGWLERADWQSGGWEFDWSVLAVSGDTAAVGATGVYAKLGTFSNLWTVTFAEDRCAVFRMYNNEV